MKFHIEREFNAEYSEIFLYDGVKNEFIKYYRKYDAENITDFNCTKGTPKTPLNKTDKPFIFTWISPDAKDEGPLIFDTYHAEAYRWGTRHTYKPLEV